MQKRKTNMRKPIFSLIVSVVMVALTISVLGADKPKAETEAEAEISVARDKNIPTHVIAPITYLPPVEESPIELTTVDEVQSEPEIPSLASESDIELLARTIWAEAGCIDSKAEQAAVAWCVLNRVDARGKSISEIILAPHQFACKEADEVPEKFILLAKDVIHRWEQEHAGIEDVGRTLPTNYQYFIGDGKHNHFSAEWKSTDYWDWSLPDPYNSEHIEEETKND